MIQQSHAMANTGVVCWTSGRTFELPIEHLFTWVALQIHPHFSVRLVADNPERKLALNRRTHVWHTSATEDILADTGVAQLF